MPLLTRRELEALVESRAGPCVSMFMPTHRAAPEKQQDPADLKNLIRRVETKLLAKGLKGAERQRLMARAWRLVENPRSWECPGDGMAVFASPGFHREYHLPIPMEQFEMVSDRFHLKPLLPAFMDGELYYVLALSQHDVRMFACTPHTVAEVRLGDTPRSLAEALHYDDPQNQIQFHSTPSVSGAGRGTAIFHGHGAAAADAKRGLLCYFQQVDERVRRVLKEQRAPLVLAGVEYLLGIYRTANSYPELVARGVEGNPELLTGRELHQRAWEVVRPAYERRRQAEVERYHQLASTSGQASNNLEIIVRGAHQGRVAVRWVGRKAHRWGRYDPGVEAMEVHDSPTADDEDLLDLAAVHSLLGDGVVHVVEPEQVPNKAAAAAIFRY